MIEFILIFFVLLIAVTCVGISILLIHQDKEIRRLKPALEEQTKQAQNNTKELEKFYLEKKQLQVQKDNEIAEVQAKLQDERSVTALAVKNSEMVKIQLKQQQEETFKIKLEIQKLSEQLQRSNESRLIEVQSERQKWAELVKGKENTLQKMGTEVSSIESVMDTLSLISKEMHRRLDEHYTKMRLLDEKSQENLELMAQLEH